MDCRTRMMDIQHGNRTRDFRSVRIFSLITFLYSWPIFFVVDAWLAPMYFERGEFAAGILIAVFGHLSAMAGPGIAALILWRINKEPLPRWKWSRGRYYIWAAAAMLVLWTLPGVIGLLTNKTLYFRNPIEPFAWVVISSSFTIAWFAGLGEETGWTAYLLPRLAPHIGRSRALITSGAIRGLWHWPVLTGPLIWQVCNGDKSLGMMLGFSVLIAFQLIISNALFGSLFGWVWYKTGSLPLLGWLHQWFDATRDVTSLLIVGYGAGLWFTTLWAIPFNLVAAVVLMQVAREEGASLWTFALPGDRDVL